MAKEFKLSITDLKKQSNKLPSEEVLKLLVESYKISDKVQVLVNVKLKGNEGIGDIVELYKSEINKEFFPNRGFGKLRVSVVKRAIL